MNDEEALIQVDENGEMKLGQFLTYRLARVQAKLNAQATRMLKDVSGLSLTQWRIMMLIAATGTARSSDLTRAAEFDKGQFSRKLKTLIQSGLVRARVNENDHRVQMLSLTDSGRQLYEFVLPRMQARQRALRDVLTEQELDAVFSALDKLEVASERVDFDT